MTENIIKNVIEPLEQRGNRVNVYFTSPRCHMNHYIYSKYGTRLKGILEKETTDQRDSIENGLWLSHESKKKRNDTK